LEPKENIEQLFKNAFDKHEEQVSPDLWNKISNDLNNVPTDDSQTGNSANGSEQLSQAITGSKGLGIGFWGGAAVVAITATTMYFVIPSDESSSISEENQQAVAIEEAAKPASQQQEKTLQITEQQNSSTPGQATNSDYNDLRTENAISETKIAEEHISSSSQAVKTNSIAANSTEQGTITNKQTTATVSDEPATLASISDPVIPEVSKNENESNSKPSVQNKSSVHSYPLTATPKKGVAPLDVNLKLTEFHGEVTWDFGDGASGFGGTTISHQYEIPGTYTAWAKFTDGSGEEHSQPIIIIVEADDFLKNFIPNVFTPNGDGTNDVFTIKSEQLSTVDVSIYDRRGRQVAKFTDPEIGWDGLIDGGKQAEQGTYFYVIYAKGIDHQTHNYKGTLKLIR